ANFFSILGSSPAIGRDFLPDDDRVGASPMVIVTHGLWKRRFGGDPNLLGKTIILNDISCTVAGILPASFAFYRPAEVFVPYGLQDDMTMHTRELRSGNRVIGRLKPGVSVQQARAEMDSIAASLAEQYPSSNAGYGVAITSMYEDVVGDIRPTLLLLLGA